MKIQKVSTQAELDQALDAKGEMEIWICGTGRFEVRKRPAHPYSVVQARETVVVVARESSHVVARESSHVVAWESSHVVASKLVAVHRHSKVSIVKGGVVIEVERPKTPADWCEWFGVAVEGGIAILYKAVTKHLKNAHSETFQY